MAMPRNLSPQAIPIMNISGDGRTEVNTDELSWIFNQPEIQDKPVCILSISGAFRKGKSFMMNFMLKYLRNKGYQNRSWMGSRDALLDEGFAWRGGRKACTNGILIWSEVFTAIKDGEEVAILLMDTQGLFDNRTDYKTNTLIFALSTLISSVQIFNLSERIQKSDLAFLQFFTSYATAARDFLTEIEPFQTLLFLVRDWQYSEENEYGFSGGQSYLDDVLSTGQSNDENTLVRKHHSFEDIKCYLMPHPGKTVAANKKFIGHLSDIDETFIDEINPLMESLLRPENLVTKKINGHNVTATTILGYVLGCSKVLMDGKLPTIKTMLEQTTYAQTLEARKTCKEEYLKVMDGNMEKSFMDESRLEEVHRKASSVAEQKFRFLTEESQNKHHEYLEIMFSSEFEKFKSLNYSKKVAAELSVLQFANGLAEDYERNMKKVIGDSFIEETILKERHEEKSTEAVQKLKEKTEEYQNKHGNYLITNILKEWNLLENINSIRKITFEASMYKLIDELEDMYTSKWTLETKKKEFLEEEEMTKNHERIMTEINYKYSENEVSNDLKNAYLPKLKDRIERIHNNVKAENDEKRKISEEQIADEYLEEGTLMDEHEKCKKSTLKLFKENVLDENPNIDEGKLKVNVVECTRRLEKEFENINIINSTKKETLKKELENLRTEVYAEYDTIFSKVLKNAYIESGDLREKHEQVVEQLLQTMETRTIEKGPIYSEHMKIAKEKMENKFSAIEKWNEKNDYFFWKRLYEEPTKPCGIEESGSIANEDTRSDDQFVHEIGDKQQSYQLTTEDEISPSGGTMAVGRCKANFPPQAVDQQSTFQLSLGVRTNKYQITPTMTCRPSKKFNVPVKIQLTTWCSTESPDVMVEVMSQDEGSSNSQTLARKSLASTQGIIEFEVDHFTDIWAMIVWIKDLFMKVEYTFITLVFYDNQGNFPVVFLPHDETHEEKCIQEKEKRGLKLVPVKSETFTKKVGETTQARMRCFNREDQEQEYRFEPDGFQRFNINDIFHGKEHEKEFHFLLQPIPQPGQNLALTLQCDIEGLDTARFHLNLGAGGASFNMTGCDVNQMRL